MFVMSALSTSCTETGHEAQGHRHKNCVVSKQKRRDDVTCNITYIIYIYIQVATYTWIYVG